VPVNRRRDLFDREEGGQLHGERHRRLCDATLHCSLQRRKLLLPTSYLPVDALPSGPMPERRTILVTDDSSANRDLLAGQLSNLGFWTEAANNGEEAIRSEEHTSELQSRRDLVCRLLLEKKKKK